MSQTLTVTHLFTHGTFSSFSHISFFVDRFRRSLQFATQNVIRKPFLMLFTTALSLFTEKLPKIVKIKHSMNPYIQFLLIELRSLRFCHLECDKEAISNGLWHIPVFLRRGVRVLCDFRELSFCGPCVDLLS